MNVGAFKHYSANAIVGVRRGKPVLVLVRKPQDAIASLAVTAPRFTMRQLLRRWIVSHKRVQPYHDRNCGETQGLFPMACCRPSQAGLAECARKNDS